MNKQKTKIQRMLNKIGIFIEADVGYLIKGGSWLSVGQIISVITGLGLAIAFANLLSQEVFGVYKYVIAISGIIGAFSLTEMRTAILQAIARGYDGALRVGFWTNLKWSWGVILISIATGIYYFLNDNYTLAISLLFVGLFSPIIQSASFFTPFLEGKKDFKTRTIFGALYGILPAVFLITTVLLTKSPLIIVLVYFASQAFTGLFLYKLTLKKYKPNNLTDIKTIGYSKHLSFLNIFGKIAKELDKILVFHYLGAAQLAIYSFAQAPTRELQRLNKMINTLAFPKLSNTNLGDLRKTLPRKAKILFLLASAIVLMYVLFAPYLYQLLFPQYLESIVYSQVFSLIILLLPASLLGGVFTAHMRKKEIYILSLTKSLLRITLLAILLPFYGIWGAIIAIIATQVIHFIILMVLFSRI